MMVQTVPAPEILKVGSDIILLAGDIVLLRFPSVNYNYNRSKVTDWWAKEGLPESLEYDSLLQELRRISYEKSILNPEEATEKLLELYHFVTLSDTDEILCYDEEEGLYRVGGEVRIKSWLEQNSESCNRHLAHETLEKVRWNTYHGREEFDSNLSVLNLKNGLLNIDTFEFVPHNHEYLSMIQIPVSYDANTSCPEFLHFLSEVVFEEDVPIIQEWFGYCLLKAYPAQKAMLLVGDGGNGKSTLLGVLKALLGIKNISSRSLQELELNRFAKADLYGKLANIYADLPDSALKSVGTFKMLTGGDPITAEHKFKNAFTFVNAAKLTFSTNKAPEIYDDTTAFFRRWLIIKFPNFFEGRADRTLLERLTAPGELSGVLNWALEGLKRLRANGFEFSDGKSVEQVKEDYIRMSSPIRAFLMDCVTMDTNAQVPKKELYQAFVDYCNANKLPTIPYTAFCDRLGFKTERPRVGVLRVWVFKGLALRTKEEWGKDAEGLDNFMERDGDQ